MTEVRQPERVDDEGDSPVAEVKEKVAEVKETVTTFTERPVVAHILRANERFNGRLGTQFSAATAYFSVLALVPILMFAFSIVGFLLVVIDQDGSLRRTLVGFVADQVGSSSTARQIVAIINSALTSFGFVAIFGVLSAGYSGAGWMGNLKDAVRAQMRGDFDDDVVKEPIVKKTLVNLVTMLGLFVAVLITFAVSAGATAATSGVADLIGISEFGWLPPLITVVGVAVSVATSWLLFMYVFRALPAGRPDPLYARRGAMIGAVGLVLLQYAASIFIRVFSGNNAFKIFGPVIILMLFLNLFARLILFVAAWIATAHAPAFEEESEQEMAHRMARDMIAEEEEIDLGGSGGGRGYDGSRSAIEDQARDRVPQAVAVRSVKVGTGAGYVTGAATGIGIGAAVAFAVQSWRRWRER